MKSLSNKILLITGATSGFGKAIACIAASQDAKIIAIGRRAERLSELSLQFPNQIHPIACDIRDTRAISHELSQLPSSFEQIDILVNNAGLALGLGSYETQTPDDIAQMVDTNITALLHLTHQVLPGMIARNRGHIVNISSIAGTYPYPGGNVYGGTKAFITQFSLNLRADLLGKKIRVTNIEPGMCETEFSDVRFHGDSQKAANVYAGMTPLSADDIAQSVVWAINQPEHVNINRIEIMPTQQAFSAFAVHRG